MPPHRSKRAKTSHGDDTQASQSTVDASPVVISHVDNGKCTFVEMPVELLCEIMSYFPALAVPTSRQFYTPVLPPSVFERWDVLRALSQTCRLWRSIFYPMLWERMEACAVRNFRQVKRNDTSVATVSTLEEDIYEFRGVGIPVNFYKGISRLLEKVSKGLVSDPQAAQHVRTVNVSLTRCSPGTVLPAFITCLEALPNLETLQILRAHTQMTTMLNQHFSNHSFPAIRTVIVPDHGHEILRCCPNARKIICNYGDGSKIIGAIAKSCKNVEVVEGIQANKNYLKRLIKACPTLRELKLGNGIETEGISVLNALAPFKQLIRLEIQVTNYSYYKREPLIGQIVKGGKSILDNQATGKKTFRLFDAKNWVLDVPV